MSITQPIVPCLWFDDQAEDAVAFYVSVFKNSKIIEVIRYGPAGHEIHKRPAGTVLTIDFELDGQRFTALNGGPVFNFNEAVSLQIICSSQQDVDYYWERLTEGGDPAAQQCGWLKDKYGLSWQVVPSDLAAMLSEPLSPRTQQVTEAMLRMKKLDIEELMRIYNGGD